ncbi:MAG: hypothetical protein Kow0090_08620 [Myxococcota bacterium]
MELKRLRIRRLKAADAAGIRRIQRAITTAPIEIDYHKIVKEEAGRRDRIGFVAEVEDNLVGYMIAYIIQGGFGLEKSAWIALFGVEPKFMGGGIGKRLAKEIFSALKKAGIKSVFTSVRWDSTDLLSFFKSLGFDRSNFINLKRVL